MLKPKIWIGMKVHTPSGIILQETSEEGHSWVRNFYNLYAMAMVDSPILGAGLDLFGQLNTNRSSGYIIHYAGNTSTGYYHFWRGEDGLSYTNGIRLGTSDAPFDIDDYRIEDEISHGNGVGQLYHYAMPSRQVTFNKDKCQCSVIFKKTFGNNSGEIITIKNIGLINLFRINNDLVTHLMARDVLVTPINVPHGALITCTYTLSTPEFLEVLKEPLYKMGDAGSGGYYWKQMTGSVNTHLKYALILAPVDGGLSTALKWSSNTSTPALDASDTHYGYGNTQMLISQGATSPIGQFVANANANKLGGYDDWYIPARNECYEIATSFNSVAPAGEETPTGISLWSSTEHDYYRATSINVGNNSTLNENKNNYTYQVRLVRRILHRSFIPKIEE